MPEPGPGLVLTFPAGQPDTRELLPARTGSLCVTALIIAMVGSAGGWALGEVAELCVRGQPHTGTILGSRFGVAGASEARTKCREVCGVSGSWAWLHGVGAGRDQPDPTGAAEPAGSSVCGYPQLRERRETRTR